MDHARAAQWLTDYVAAWRASDHDQIVALFAPDATYRYSPWRDPIVGAAAIAEAWLKEPDDPDSWSAHYEPLAVDGDLVVSTGQTDYPEEGHTYSNMFVLRFDDQGRCREFTDWYMRHPKPK